MIVQNALKKSNSKLENRSLFKSINEITVETIGKPISTANIFQIGILISEIKHVFITQK